MADKNSVPLQKIGKTGLVYWGGSVDEEYLRELQGGRWLRVVRQMQDDPILAASLLAIELLIRQVSWSVTGDDEETAVFVEEQRKSMDKAWDEIMSEVLTFLPWGFSLLEIVYKRLDNGRVGWADWSIRAQETVIDGWVFGGDGGLTAVEQTAAPDYRPVKIPYDKLLHFRTTARKGNPEGRSVLRGSYEAWYFSHHLKRIEAIGIERDLTGIPVARIPASVIEANSEEYTSYKNLVSNIRVDEQAGVVVPSDRDEEGHLLYDITLLTTNATRQAPTDPVIARYEQQKAMTLLTDVIMLGHGRTGTQALAKEKQKMLTNALNAYLEMVAEVVNKYAIPRLLRFNGIDKDFPILAFSPIETVDLESLGLFVKRLSDSGFDWSDDEAVDERLRQQADLPLR